jgi:hypothetical protein
VTIFDGIRQRPISIRGIPALAPVFYRDVRMMLGVFAAPLAAVRAALPTDRLRPLRLSARHGMVAVACFEYRDTDIGAFNDVAIAVGATLAGGSGLVSLARAAVGRRFECFVADLPVNTEVAWHSGLDWFRYPKTLADIRFEEDRHHRTCTVRDPSTGEPIYVVRSQKSPTRPVAHGRSEGTTRILSYPWGDGELLAATFRVEELRRGLAFGADAMTLRCTTHPRARPLRELHPGRLLMHTWAPDARAVLLEPKPL